MTVTSPGPDGRRSRWDEHRLARRDELVDATLRAIRLHGAGVGMDDIAATAGTSKTVVYRHFTDRAGLYTAVAERVDATIIRGLTRAAEGAHPPGGSVRARSVIHQAVAAYLELVEEDPEVYRFIVNAPIVPAGEPSGRDVAAGMTDRISAHVAGLVEAGLTDRARGFQPLDPVRPQRLWGVALVGMVRASADAWLAAGGAASGTTRENLAQDLATLAWDGLSTLAIGEGRHPGRSGSQFEPGPVGLTPSGDPAT
ncbi:MAG: TetR/AcrR family transcriptional regulator [Ornithinibacter sp.]